MQTEKMCPILSVATLQKEEGRVINAGGTVKKGGFLQACVEAKCAMWSPIQDETGKPLGGACAFALLPPGLGQLGNVMAAIATGQIRAVQPSAPALNEANNG